MKTLTITTFLGLLFTTCTIVLGNTGSLAGTELNNNIGTTENIPVGKIIPHLAEIAYSGGEYFQFDVSWTGGIKIGEIYLEVTQSEQCSNCFEINSTITSSGGIVHRFYPIRDTHKTLVKGEDRLPFFCEIWQKQGRDYKAHKLIQYDQDNHIIVKQKDGEAAKTFNLDGVVHNEFSSFLSSRVMKLEIGQPILVPTFGNDKRHDVVVNTLEKNIVEDSVFGQVKTIKVAPILTFTGLYDKSGDTIVWYTDDECRVPVMITSKIFIGSLTASLAKYRNPACERYNNKVIEQ